MPNIIYGWDRRKFLHAGMGGFTYLTLGGIPMSALAETPSNQLAGKVLNLVFRYRTDPERIARALPPALEVDEVADVMLDWWVRYPTPGSENLYYPAVYSECGIHVTAKYQGQRGMFQVGMPLDQEWGRTMGRENVGLVKKDGTLNLQRAGNVVTADLRRRGKLLYRIKTRITDQPAHPLYWHRETGFGAFLYRYRLNPNWRQGPLSADPVELWLRVLGGKRGYYPDAMTVGGPRACDFAQTQFEFMEPSVLDPFCEFPFREIVGISYSETGYVPRDEAAYRPQMPKTPTRIERLQMIDSKAFEPWALMNYDRPITRGKAWAPANWPDQATALKLNSRELQQYRERPAYEFEIVAMTDLQLQIDPAIHARTLPSTLQAGAQPVVRILAFKIGGNDFSTESYNELWLLSRCEQNGKEAWYALSHIVGTGGDVCYGRETFGYPSKTGTVGWQDNTMRSALSGERMGRQFVQLKWQAAKYSAGVTGATITVIGLRLHPAYRLMTLTGFTEPGAQAELIAQPWAVELTGAATLNHDRVAIDFPVKPGAGKIGTPDPWFEFKNGKLISARVGKGMLRRLPAENLGVLPNYKPYYLERIESADTTESALSGNVKHTFLIADST